MYMWGGGRGWACVVRKKARSMQIYPPLFFMIQSESPNPDSGIVKNLVVEFGIQLKESGIPTMLGSQNPSSIDKDWNPTPGIWNLRPGIQNPRLSWIS